MLKSNEAILVYRDGEIIPDRLHRGREARFLSYGEKMLETYQKGLGLERRVLHQAVRGILALESRRAPAFCRVLDRVATFDRGPFQSGPRLRRLVFSRAGEWDPVNDDDRGDALRNRIAREVGVPWNRIEGALYSDLHALQRLNSFPADLGPESLLSRYNVAQLQAGLYRAWKLEVVAASDFKTLLRHARFCGLLHRIEKLGVSRYSIELTGPAGILSRTSRYGVDMARFLPGLLACRKWTLCARAHGPFRSHVALRLSSSDGFQSHIPRPPRYDSDLERSFAEGFGKKRAGWTLYREGEILHDRQATFIPDFLLRHEEGKEVLLEIAGFWTETYLTRKIETLRRFKDPRLVVALPHGLADLKSRIPAKVIVFKEKKLARRVFSLFNGEAG